MKAFQSDRDQPRGELCVGLLLRLTSTADAVCGATLHHKTQQPDRLRQEASHENRRLQKLKAAAFAPIAVQQRAQQPVQQPRSPLKLTLARGSAPNRKRRPHPATSRCRRAIPSDFLIDYEEDDASGMAVKLEVLGNNSCRERLGTPLWQLLLIIKLGPAKAPVVRTHTPRHREDTMSLTSVFPARDATLFSGLCKYTSHFPEAARRGRGLCKIRTTKSAPARHIP